MITERTIINAFIILGVLVIMPLVVSSTFAQDNIWPSVIIVGLIALMAAFFLFKDTLSFWPLMAGGSQVAFNFLPLKLTLTNVFCVLLILYYVTGYFVIRQKRIRLGMPRFFYPIMILMAILIYHNHTLAIKACGSEDQGTRPVFLTELAFLAYVCGINVGTPSAQFVSKMPLYILLTALAGTVPFMLTTLVPPLAPILAAVTNQVNVEAYASSMSDQVGDDSEGMNRLPVLGMIGIPLQSYLLVYYPIGTWIRPERWWVLILSILCAYFTMQTGFRSTFFVYGMTIMAATWCYYSWRSLALPVGLAIGLVALVAASANNLISIPTNKLPLVAQRTLSFLPGDWDPQVISSAASSNHFRDNIISVYEKEYFWKSPFIGNGYNIDTKMFENLGDMLMSGQARDDTDYYQAKLFIEGKMFHTGWVSLYDIVGAIGFVAFLALGIAEIYTVGEWLFEAKADRRSSLYPCYIWMFCSIVAKLFSFFAVFGDFAIAFQGMLIDCIVLSQISDLRQISDVPIARNEPDISSDLTRAGGRYGYGYGYQSRY